MANGTGNGGDIVTRVCGFSGPADVTCPIHPRAVIEGTRPPVALVSRVRSALSGWTAARPAAAWS